MGKVKIVCGWCGKELGWKDGKRSKGTVQGVCDDCLRHNFPHIYEKIIEILEVDNIEDIYKEKTESEVIL